MFRSFSAGRTTSEEISSGPWSVFFKWMEIRHGNSAVLRAFRNASTPLGGSAGFELEKRKEGRKERKEGRKEGKKKERKERKKVENKRRRGKRKDHRSCLCIINPGCERGNLFSVILEMFKLEIFFQRRLITWRSHTQVFSSHRFPSICAS